MPRSGIYKCLNNSELAYYFAGRVACQPLFFRHSAWGQCAVALFGGQRVVRLNNPLPPGNAG